MAPAPRPAAAAGMAVQRFGGADRFATAASVSAAHFAPGVAAAFVATGADFPDALAGGPAAARAGGPILLVGRNEIPPATQAELVRLRPSRIVVLGGAGVISDAVVAALAGYQTGGGVQRVGGADRYATAALVSRQTFAPGLGAAYVATGLAFPDALVGGAAAARAGSPVLLTRPGTLPSATVTELRRLAPARSSCSVARAPWARGWSLSCGASQPPARSSGSPGRTASPRRSRSAAHRSRPACRACTWRPVSRSRTRWWRFPPRPTVGAALLLVPGSAPVPSAIRNEAARLRPARLALLGGMAAMNERVTFDLRVAVGDLAPLPACAYRDVLTRYRGYSDWQRTLLDTILMVPADYAPGDLVDTSRAGLNAGHAVRGHVVNDLKAMSDAARAAGRPIQVASAYRSYSAQVTTFDHWVQGRRLPAGPAHQRAAGALGAPARDHVRLHQPWRPAAVGVRGLGRTPRRGVDGCQRVALWLRPELPAGPLRDRVLRIRAVALPLPRTADGGRGPGIGPDAAGMAVAEGLRLSPLRYHGRRSRIEVVAVPPCPSSRSSAPSGAMKARDGSSTIWPTMRTSSSATAAATTPATRWSTRTATSSST